MLFYSCVVYYNMACHTNRFCCTTKINIDKLPQKYNMKKSLSFANVSEKTKYLFICFGYDI